MSIYLYPEVSSCLDDMITDLRAIIQSRSVPDSVLPGLRATLATLMVAVTDTVPEPLHISKPLQLEPVTPEPTWSTDGGAP